MMKFEKGDRVYSSVCGLGTIQESDFFHQAIIVSCLFDNTPPWQFNMGQNPTMFSSKQLVKVPINTESVYTKPCDCQAVDFLPCSVDTCSVCHGRGWVIDRYVMKEA